MNIFSGSKKDRGIFFATTAFVVTFAIILAIAYAMQIRVSQSSDYRLVASSVEQWVSAGDSSQAKTALSAMQGGGNIVVAGKTLTLPELNKYLNPQSFDVASIITSIDGGNNTEALAKAKQLNQTISAKHQKRKSLAATMMIVSAVVTLLLYAALMVPMFSRRQDAEETAVVAKSETEGIMNTVSEGLFLLGNDHQIGVEQSASLKRMFKLERELEGDFFDFISSYVTQENVRIAKDYLELLFGDRVKEKLVEDLNPLNNVEISLVRRDGQYENRYLDFRFKRVLIDGAISHLLGSVTDVTRQVELEQQLAQTKEEQEAQVDLLMNILHIDNDRLQGFISHSTETLEQINERLSERGHSDGQIRSKLVDIISNAHRLKGDAAALGLHKFEFGAHDFEEELENIRRSDASLSGKDLLPAITKLRGLYSEMDRMTDLISKFSEAMTTKGDSGTKLATELAGINAIANEIDVNSEQSTDLSDESSDLNTDQDSVISTTMDSQVDTDSVQTEEASTDTKADLSTIESTLHNLCNTVGERNDTPVELSLDGLSDDSLPSNLTDIVNDALIQFIRNSIVHGYEGAQQRQQLGKKEEIGINIVFEQTDEGYTLKYRDNGQGINPSLVKEKAVERGIITKKTAETLEKNKIITLLFHPGFSTLDKATLDGGRGVGLDVVLKRVKEQSGAISVSSALGRFSQFTIRFPHSN